MARFRGGGNFGDNIQSLIFPVIFLIGAILAMSATLSKGMDDKRKKDLGYAGIALMGVGIVALVIFAMTPV
jgi:hypothetical protein